MISGHPDARWAGGSADAAAGLVASPEQAPEPGFVEAEPSPLVARKVLKLTDEEILTLYRFAQAEAAHEADWRGLPQELCTPCRPREGPALGTGADYLELLKKAMEEPALAPIARAAAPEESEEAESAVCCQPRKAVHQVMQSAACDETEPCPRSYRTEAVTPL
ncbi:unnamed protein product [Symbiodinium natans]|uniref:Uncharacterized protein n=1 Tax=Symbiodinium natans TaxID=878477 RepID=A0A812QZ92_9DINO|nr:unnamed protein product [Symbiodinium natans]